MSLRGPFPILLSVALLAALLSGCVSSDDPPEPSVDGDGKPGAGPWAVVALVDTGINPYHADFRLPAELADIHPSEYIPGYPTDIPAVNITFDAEDVKKALEADADVWAGLEPQTPYWFRGTKVTGISFAGGSEDPGPIFSTGHGTMVASKAGGVGYSLCPECHIVAVQGFNAVASEWAADQAWIDVQSNSWGPLPAFAWADRTGLLSEPDTAERFERAAAKQAVFVASGNGIAGAFGVVGFPSPTDSTSGPPGVISVGGNDNGKTTLWTGWFPHVVADACDNWAALGHTLDEYSERAGGGTSAASPYTAGAAARLVLEARALLQSDAPRDVETGVYAVAGPDALLPSSGPLADGDLTLDELKHLLFHTATPRPQADGASGAECGIDPASPTSALYHTGVAWSNVPDGTTIYPWVGYGSVEEKSVAFALQVLAGAADPLDRPDEDDLYAEDQRVRALYHGTA